MQVAKQRARRIQKILEELFPYPEPFLDHTSIFTLLIAVILSARCTDKKVNEITPALFALADTPEKMSLLKVEEIQELIRPCGLSPAKSRAIKETSQILVAKYQGEVPGTFEALEELPGVGHKTASVVISQGFSEPAFPVDTHIYRLARRWGLSVHKSVHKVEEDLKKLFPRRSWHDVHLQMIEAGRKFCPALRHHVDECPICSQLALETAPSGNRSLPKKRAGPRRTRSSPARKKG